MARRSGKVRGTAGKTTGKRVAGKSRRPKATQGRNPPGEGARLLASIQKEIASLRRDIAEAKAREAQVRQMLDVDARTKKGDRTVVKELLDRIEALEGYLLNNTKRIENILSALKTHREYLIKLNRKAFASTPRDVMRVELGIMNNTLGILALNGVKVSEDLFRDIHKLELDMRSETAKIGELQRRKDELDLRFKTELGQHDVDEILASRKEVYGYR